MSINQKPYTSSILVETSDNARHQITNDDQITDPNSKAFDCDRSIEYDSCVWVCNLRKSEKRRSAAVKVSSASCLEVEAEACGQAGPEDDDDTEEHSHAGKGEWHGQYTSPND